MFHKFYLFLLPYLRKINVCIKYLEVLYFVIIGTNFIISYAGSETLTLSSTYSQLLIIWDDYWLDNRVGQKTKFIF